MEVGGRKVSRGGTEMSRRDIVIHAVATRFCRIVRTHHRGHACFCFLFTGTSKLIIVLLIACNISRRQHNGFFFFGQTFPLVFQDFESIQHLHSREPTADDSAIVFALKNGVMFESKRTERRQLDQKFDRIRIQGIMG